MILCLSVQRKGSRASVESYGSGWATYDSCGSRVERFYFCWRLDSPPSYKQITEQVLLSHIHCYSSRSCHSSKVINVDARLLPKLCEKVLGAFSTAERCALRVGQHPTSPSTPAFGAKGSSNFQSLLSSDWGHAVNSDLRMCAGVMLTLSKPFRSLFQVSAR